MTNIVIERLDYLEVMTLDRPEVLNALNGDMVKAILVSLAEIEKNSTVQALFIKGSGERAFCAGGDIKAARLGAIAVKEGRITLDKVVEFFVEEYAMNKALFHCSKPTVSFMNGITMGGGVGVAGACKYRIATEKTVWAMPEVTIGFFPDVGAAYYLARAPENVGKYLGLTGGHLSNPADLIECGFATHFIPSAKQEILIEDLVQKNTETVLNAHAVDAGEAGLPYDRIKSYFAPSTVEEILVSLERDGTEWALETIKVIQSKSPLSLKVALRHIEQAAAESFDEVIARDLRLAAKFLAGHDLIEGVRAVVVDKDKSPKWNPARLEDVGLDKIEAFFN